MKENIADSYYTIIDLFRQVTDAASLIRCLFTEYKERSTKFNDHIPLYETSHIYYNWIIPNTPS